MRLRVDGDPQQAVNNFRSCGWSFAFDHNRDAGTVTDINEALDGLSFDPDVDRNGDVTLTISNDLSAPPVVDTVDFEVTPVSDRPVADDDNASTNEDFAGLSTPSSTAHQGSGRR